MRSCHYPPLILNYWMRIIGWYFDFRKLVCMASTSLFLPFHLSYRTRDGLIRFTTCIFKYVELDIYSNIALFRSITLFFGTNNIQQNIFHVQSEWWNIPSNVDSPTKHCYGFEWCCENLDYLVVSIKTGKHVNTFLIYLSFMGDMWNVWW